ncbi:MAG: 4-hydroxybutyrate CoA-transferase [Deltaproteobacteria bacterium]|nr:4-hydroxybutyrate CoA-transferase [Deltaproteobacteria bacterium]
MGVIALTEAVEQVRARDTLAVPLGPGQPVAFLHALGERANFEDLRVFAALLIDEFPLFTRPGVKLYSGFFGPVERGLARSGFDVSFIPSDFRGFAGIAGRMRPRLMATAVAPPDPDGWLSLSLHAGATVGELQRCGRDPERILIAEIQPGLPRTLGLPPDHPHALHVDDVDLIVESPRPPFTLPDDEPSETDKAIAGHALRYVHDGCTLQTGIGGVPTEIVELLADGDGGDYGIHSEMFTEGLWKLHRARKVTNRKGIHDGYSVTTFALGTGELYAWLDGNEQVRFLPVDQVNALDVIARCRDFLSINAALAVDLTGQIVADAIGPRQYSGIGGHFDFSFAAPFSPGGRSLTCLPSTVTIDGKVVSRINAVLPAGSVVTTPRHAADVIISEFGAAELAGKTVAERAEALIEIAHPDYRDELRRDWATRA